MLMADLGSQVLIVSLAVGCLLSSCCGCVRLACRLSMQVGMQRQQAGHLRAATAPAANSQLHWQAFARNMLSLAKPVSSTWLGQMPLNPTFKNWRVHCVTEASAPM